MLICMHKLLSHQIQFLSFRPMVGSCMSQRNILIRWTSQNIQNVKIDISTNNGTSWNNIISSTPASSGQANWLIPVQFSSDECLIRICDVQTQTICDESDNTFIIQPVSSVTVISPNGGEFWLIGSTQDINWTSEAVTDVRIDLSLNNGASWTSIVDSTPSIGIYSWEVSPATTSALCLIKITNLANETVFDISDDVFQIDILPSVNEQFSGIPENYTLIQNYPNPFNPLTKIYYGVPQKSYVELKVFDLIGNEIKSLVSEEKIAGYHSVSFDASNYNSGVYFYQLQAGPFVETKKMVLMK